MTAKVRLLCATPDRCKGEDQGYPPCRYFKTKVKDGEEWGQCTKESRSRLCSITGRCRDYKPKKNSTQK